MDEQEAVDLAFADQVGHDFPDQPVDLPLSLTWTARAPKLSYRARYRVWRLWMRQGRPRNRGIIVQTGTIVPGDVAGTWELTDWLFDGRYCHHSVASLELDVVGHVNVLRAVCGWHIPDLIAASTMPAEQLKLKSIW